MNYLLNMESMTNSNDEGNAQHSSTDDNTDEKEDVTSTHLIPGYETFDKYLEVYFIIENCEIKDTICKFQVIHLNLPIFLLQFCI